MILYMLNIVLMMNKRTWCKYNDCELEKFESELSELTVLWDRLVSNWRKPEDAEDLYRVYPLLKTTSALVRCRVQRFKSKSKEYNVKVVIPGYDDAIVVDDMYRYSDETRFFCGVHKEMTLADVTSKFLHVSEFCYMDDSKIDSDDPFEIYLYVCTDEFCASCADANLIKTKTDGPNYRKKARMVRYTDCTCGYYVNVNSYISSLKKVLVYFAKQQS